MQRRPAGNAQDMSAAGLRCHGVTALVSLSTTGASNRATLQHMLRLSLRSVEAKNAHDRFAFVQMTEHVSRECNIFDSVYS